MKPLFFSLCLLLLCSGSVWVFSCTSPNSPDPANVHNEVLPPPTETVVPTNPLSTIDPLSFDADLLTSLVADKINELRRTKTRCPSLHNDAILASAADEQSRYVTQKGNLSHEQTGSSNRNKQTVLDRVRLYGGAFTPVGENLLFQGFKRRVYDDGRELILYPTYDEMARQMVKGWQNSKPHYANIIDCSFNNSGVAVMYSAKKDGIFAAQVFGGN